MFNDDRQTAYIVQPRCNVPEEEMAKVRADITAEINYMLEPENCFNVINDVFLGYGSNDDPDVKLTSMCDSLIKMAEADYIIFAPGWRGDWECSELYKICEHFDLKIVDFEEVYL